MRYKLLIGAIIALVPAYSGYWFFIAGKIRDATENFTTEFTRQGLDLQYAGKSLSGFPYRLILDYDRPRLTGPGWTWQAPRVEAFAQPYDLTRYIISAPGPHLVELTPPGGLPVRLSLEAETARASMDFTADSQLNQFDVDFQSLKLRDLMADEAFQAGRAQAHLRPSPQSPENPGPALDIAFKAEDLDLPGQLAVSLLGEPISLVQATAALRGIGAIEALSLIPVLIRSGNEISLGISEASIVWGKLTITGKGELSLDDLNRPQGELQLTIIGHEEILNQLEQKGLIEPGIAGTLRATLGAMAGMNDGRAVITITLRDGVASAGFIRFGKLKPLF